VTGDQEHPPGFEPPRRADAPPLAEHVDRRRPERPKHVSENLLPLLRFKPSPEQVEAARQPTAASEDPDDADGLRAARGIAFGLVAAGLLWGVLAALLIWF
jgi:hypothetical protein